MGEGVDRLDEIVELREVTDCVASYPGALVGLDVAADDGPSRAL